MSSYQWIILGLPAISAAASAPTTTAAAAAATTTAATATATATGVGFRSSFVDIEGTSIQIQAIGAFNGCLGFLIVVHGHEAKAS